MNKQISRRDFLKLAGGAVVVVAGASVMPQFLRKNLLPENITRAAGDYDLFYAGTDGWIHLPEDQPIGFYFPDDIAPAPFNTYIFGFRNLTGMTSDQITAQKEHAQHSAPLFWLDQYEKSNRDFKLQLTNLGLQIRPDLTDSHTLHWHGFRNVITFFDGEPTGSVSVPVGREFTYVYRPHEPGTYMFHCHVEDVEHVHMGMTGLVFVRPAQDGQNFGGLTRFAYNDGDGSTGYNREFAMFLSEVWAEAHWADSHIQLPDWSDYRADFSLLNGRVYPDTLAPNAAINPSDTAQQSLDGQFNAIPYERTAVGELLGVAGRSDLQYQPMSSLVTCQQGERVLLRFANLGFREAAMTLAGIKMKVVGRDATIMRGRDGTDTSYETDTISMGAGESYDVIFTAPDYVPDPAGYNTYILYNRRLTQVANGAGNGFGGQRTEIRVYPGGLNAQQFPNDWGI
jgi:FtsP/CotA-like multicopper oxidase with cupredoxin domain